jgi:mRNA-degrading endonuclease RelE of RelBE toxin-antitoxin system
MEFRIAVTFTSSLAKLTGDEQKAVKTTAFDLQLDPSNPGMSFHKLDKAKDKHFWSVRVNRDIRLIVHKTAASLLLCYVDHHDKAYAWAERRKLETHPVTGAAQLVEIRERVQEILVPVYISAETPAVAKPRLFDGVSDDALLGYGVPAEWLADVRIATEDNLFDVADHLPQEAAEALLELATGATPKVPSLEVVPANPFEHPDAQRRFRVVENVDELERALDFPWDKWSVFLHPAQRQTVERSYSGPARVTGSAGTGKTVVALHRAVYLARTNPDARVLLTTFSETLASALRTKLRRLIGSEPRLGERLEVHALNAVAIRLYERNIGPVKLADSALVARLVAGAAAAEQLTRFSQRFLVGEWTEVIDAWQLRTWEAYRDVARLGRKTRLPEKQREALWKVFERVRTELTSLRLLTQADVLSSLSSHFAESKKRPFDFIVVDEAQDLTVPQVRFLAVLGANEPNRLFFAGDLGQRIFQQPFSWKALGVDIRGRASTLRINYRTSHQIRLQADKLLGAEISDVDGNEERRGAISVFNGPAPLIARPATAGAEADAVTEWLKERSKEGVAPGEMAVFVRSEAQMTRAVDAVKSAAIPFRTLDASVDTRSAELSVGTMHLAKGLEFRAVVVMACDDDVLPLQERIEAVTDDSDLEEVYNTERHLLYVACTRARDFLFVSGVMPVSEYLDDLEL